MASYWNKKKVNEYPYYLPKDCTDNRVEMYEQFIKDFEIEAIGEIHNIGKMGRFLDGDRSYNNTGKEIIYDEPPYGDHAKIFRNKAGCPLYVYHPYDINLDELEKWCNERDIIYCFCDVDQSFYYPGSSYMVVLMSDMSWFYYNNILDVIKKYEHEGTERIFEYKRKEK